MPGPPPTPRKILELRGSDLAPHRADLDVPVERPKCPRGLSARAKTVWKETVEQLLEIGILARIDGRVLAVYCETWAQWFTAIEQIHEHGAITINSETGEIVEPPYVKRAERLATLILRYARHFGLTPAARTALAQPIVPNKDENRGKTKAEKYFA